MLYVQIHLQLKQRRWQLPCTHPCLLDLDFCLPTYHTYILSPYNTDSHTYNTDSDCQTHTQKQIFTQKTQASTQDMLGISEEDGGAVSSSEVGVVTSSQEVHITSDEHLARQLQAFENILIGTPDREFHDIMSLEPPPSQFIEPNPVSVPVPLEAPLSDDGLNSENVPLEAPLSDDGLNSENVPREDNINPDNMTYEELQSLGEQIGTENKGLSDELISYLPTSKYRTGFFSRNVTEECVVCKTYYKNGQKLITLPCQHRYHADCITQWLQLNKVCPVCNEEVFGS